MPSDFVVKNVAQRHIGSLVTLWQSACGALSAATAGKRKDVVVHTVSRSREQAVQAPVYVGHVESLLSNVAGDHSVLLTQGRLAFLCLWKGPNRQTTLQLALTHSYLSGLLRRRVTISSDCLT